MFIDTPGMRELGNISVVVRIDVTFSEITTCLPNVSLVNEMSYLEKKQKIRTSPK